VQQLPPVALPLGLMTGSAYSEQRITLAPGDLLVVYSDGLTEAESREHDLFGEERLLQLIPQLRGMGAEAAGRRLLAEVQRFVADQRQSDDLSLILARRTP
jgi:phosphoserine phosphatase RsbU/P